MRIKLLLIVLLIVITNENIFALSLGAAGSLHSIRWYHESQVLNNGQVLVFGGDNGYVANTVYYASAELYDRGSNSWTITGSMSQKRTWFASAMLNDGRVMAIGGTDGTVDLRTCEFYDPSTGLWSSAPSMNEVRSLHKAVRLGNGQVLVAGNDDQSCEVFDPVLNQWTYTGNMNKSHGEGMTMVLLNDGKVLACGGGYNNDSTAELFDPALGTWTLTARMKGLRRYHAAVTLSNGKVLIYGSAETSDRKTAELFDPGTGTFTVTGSIHADHVQSPGILLDDGTVLSWGLGDVTTPTDTKVFETYDPVSGLWTPFTTTFYGSQVYSINRLFTGEILIAGGGAGGNGAITTCYLFGAPQGGACTTPDNTLIVSNSNSPVCKGKDAIITVIASEFGVNYTALISGLKTGNTVAGGGTIHLTIPASFLVTGSNVITVQAIKAGCNGIMLNDTTAVTVTQDNITYPTLTAMGTTTFCDGGNVTLKCSAGTGYLWCSGQTTDTISVTKRGYYFCSYTDANGCMGYPSDTIYVNVLEPASSVSAGADLSACTTDAPVTLAGTPAGGTWTGAGATSGGLFTPSIAGAGTFPLVYSYCGMTDTMNMTVQATPDIDAFKLGLNGHIRCQGSMVNIYVWNKIPGATYACYVNGTDMGSATTQGDSIWWQTGFLSVNADIKITANYYSTCGSLYSERYDTSYVAANANQYLSLASDSICAGQAATVKIFNSQAGIKYVLVYNSLPVSDTAMGNGTTLLIPTKAPLYTTLTVRAINSAGCMVVLYASVTTKERWVTMGITSLITGAFIGDTVRFINASNADTYVWNIDSIVSTKVTPDPVTFNSTGYKVITLTGSIPGCSVTYKDSIEIVSLTVPHASAAAICTYDTLPRGAPFDNEVYAFHVDNNGNRYISITSLSTVTEYRKYPLVVSKFDKNNKLIWNKTNDYYDASGGDFNSNFVVDIESDNDGNVYLAGTWCGDYFIWDNDTIARNTDGNNYHQGYVVKLDSNGVVKWHIRTSPCSYTNGFTDILYLNDSDIYISAYLPLAVTFADKTIINCANSTIGVFRIDKDGKYIKGFTTSETNLTEAGLFSKYDPDAATDALYNDASLSPKLTLSANGKILVTGKSPGGDPAYYSIKFGALNYPRPRAVNAFAAVLDPQNGWEKVIPLFSHSSMPAYDPKSVTVNFATDANNDFYVADYSFDYSSLDVWTYDTIFVNGSPVYPAVKGSFVAKINQDGNLLWLNPNSALIIKGLASVGPEVLLYGYVPVLYYNDPNNFCILNSQLNDRLGMQSKGGSDAILTSWDPDGKINWAEGIGGDINDVPYLMTADRCNDLVNLSGSTKDLSSFGNMSINVPTARIFIGTYSPSGTCTSNTAPCTFVTAVADVVKNENSEIEVFPNPAHESFTIFIGISLQDASVKISTLLGQEVYSGAIHGKQVTLAIKLPQGIYFVIVNDKERQYIKKLVVN